jgi:hypothetical protein
MARASRATYMRDYRARKAARGINHDACDKVEAELRESLSRRTKAHDITLDQLERLQAEVHALTDERNELAARLELRVAKPAIAW